MKNTFKLQPKIVIVISVIIGIVMITSAYFELNESKKEIFRVLSEQSSSLIETISLSSLNTLSSSNEIENLIAERLLDNARLIRNLDSLNLLSEQSLTQIGKVNKLYRINIFDKKGNRILSNRIPLPGHIHPEGNVNRFNELKPILTGETKEMVIGLKNAQYVEGERFAVAVARVHNRGAIVINLDAKDFHEFRKKIGIGRIIRDIADNAGIEYIALQDTEGILAASTSVKSMDPITGDEFLGKAMRLDSIFIRVAMFNDQEVYEVVKRLEIEGDVIGIYRIGISLDEVKNIEAKMYRRMIVISLLLAAISIIVLSIIFTTQNLKAVSKEFSKFKTFTGTVLENMGEAVIVINIDNTITLFNKSAEDLFKIKSDAVINHKLNEGSTGAVDFITGEILNQGSDIDDIQKLVEIDGQMKYLSLNISRNINDRGEIENYTIVIKDFTDRKNLEDQTRRQEKLVAMGELASGVAHEIRNPINAIGMIAQRLNKEFKPAEDTEEYSSITMILKDEVTRINKIITQFLNYAKPLEIQQQRINAKTFFDGIYQLFIDQSKLKKIDFEIIHDNSLKINIDPELMKQALLNVVQNAIDAVTDGGKITIKYYKKEDNFIIVVEDNGTGIPEDRLKRIFDLYFTTKKDGNGLGLSISQKIISQHNGSIEVKSQINKGTIFKIKLPIT